MSTEQSKAVKMDTLRRAVIGSAHLVRLNQAGLDHASHLLDVTPSLTVPQILAQVNNIANIPADRI